MAIPHNLKDEYGLSEQQRLFCDEYIRNGGNGALAYQFAYPDNKSIRTAASSAHRLINRRPKVKEYLELFTEEVVHGENLEGKDFIKELISIAMRDTKEHYEKKYNHLKNKVVKEETTTFTPSIDESMKALQMLGKWLNFEDPNNDLVRREFEARIKKLEAEASIMEHTANKLEGSEQVNDLLESLLDVVKDD